MFPYWSEVVTEKADAETAFVVGRVGFCAFIIAICD
jgi:hypothetical protein